MLSALLGATSALVDGSRSAVLRRASAPRCAATDCPLSNLNCPFGTTSPPAPPPSAESAVAESLERVAESLESSLQSSLGIERPLACVAGEAAIDAIVRAACDELGSLEVSVESPTSLSLIGGDVQSVRVVAVDAAAGGLRASSVALSVAEARVDPGFSVQTPFAPPRPPNLAASVPLEFSVAFSQDDCTRSPVLFAALQECLREVVREGASAAIGELLPREKLTVNLRSVESLQAGKVVLVADATTTRDDGSTLALQGMRVRTRARVGEAGRLVVLDSPELLSTFEGFGATLEVGLPFLRGAGIPLPAALTLSALDVDGGAINVRGRVTLEPIDYSELARLADELRAAAAAPPRTVTVDATTAEGDGGPPPPGRPALPA